MPSPCRACLVSQSFAGWILQVIRFCILLNGLIPISLYVTIEMVKILQCIWILNSDRQVRVRGGRRARVWAPGLQCIWLLNSDSVAGVAACAPCWRDARRCTTRTWTRPSAAAPPT